MLLIFLRDGVLIAVLAVKFSLLALPLPTLINAFALPHYRPCLLALLPVPLRLCTLPCWSARQSVHLYVARNFLAFMRFLVPLLLSNRVTMFPYRICIWLYLFEIGFGASVGLLGNVYFSFTALHCFLRLGGNSDVVEIACPFSIRFLLCQCELTGISLLVLFSLSLSSSSNISLNFFSFLSPVVCMHFNSHFYGFAGSFSQWIWS